MPDAILYEHDDGRWAVNPVTTGDPGWHRVGPVDVSALAPAPAAEPVLEWCVHCGEGTTGFCRSKCENRSCPKGLQRPGQNSDPQAQRAVDLPVLAIHGMEARQREAAGDTGQSWQPIDTAPRDGTKIILWWGGYSRYGSYLDNSHTSVPWAGWTVPSLEVRPGGSPTLWMPMPKGPKP